MFLVGFHCTLTREGFPDIPAKYLLKPPKSFPCRFSLCQPSDHLNLDILFFTLSAVLGVCEVELLRRWFRTGSSGGGGISGPSNIVKLSASGQQSCKAIVDNIDRVTSVLIQGNRL